MRRVETQRPTAGRPKIGPVITFRANADDAEYLRSMPCASAVIRDIVACEVAKMRRHDRLRAAANG